MTSHRQKEGFKRALEEVGKIKQKTAESKREKIDLRTAYKMFTEENKAASKAFVDEEYEEMNAKEKSQQVTKVTAQLWKQKTQKEKEDYAKKRAEDLKRLREASERGENIMNLNEPDGRVQRLIVCQQCGKVCLGEQKFMKHQTEDHGPDNLEEEIRTGPGQVEAETLEEGRELFEEGNQGENGSNLDEAVGARVDEEHGANLDGGVVANVEEGEGFEAEAVELGELEEGNQGENGVDLDEAVVEIVLAQHNRNKWPAKVISRDENMVTIQILNKMGIKGKQTVLHESQLSEFEYNEVAMKKMGNNELKNAFKKAQKIIMGTELIN